MTEQRNPLEGLVPMLMGLLRREDVSPFRWAWVAATAPKVAVRFDADDSAPVEVYAPLAPVSRLSVGQRVLVLHHGPKLVLVGPAHGGSADHSAWEPLTMSAPWGQYQTVSSWGSPVACVRDGVVRLRGMATGGTAGTSAEPLAVLPSWARPARTRIGLAVANDQPVPFQVGPDGALYLRGPFSAGWVSLSSIHFPL